MKPIPMSTIRMIARYHLEHGQKLEFRGYDDSITVIEDQEDWLKRENDGISSDKYQYLSRRTQNTELSMEDKRRHALFGMSSEVGEIMSIFQHEYQGKPADKDRVKDECGDLCWFLCELLDTYFINLSDVMEYNVSKLKKRYPVSFDPKRSEHRHEYGEDAQ